MDGRHAVRCSGSEGGLRQVSPRAGRSARSGHSCGGRKALCSCAPRAGAGVSRTSAGRIRGCGTWLACRKTWCCTWHATSAARRFAGRKGSSTLGVCWGTRISRRRRDTCTWTTRSWRTHRIWLTAPDHPQGTMSPIYCATEWLVPLPPRSMMGSYGCRLSLPHRCHSGRRIETGALR